MKRINFSEEEKKKIEEAVKEAEKKTSGEIVPYFADFSDLYEEAIWVSAALFGLAGFTVSYLLTFTWNLGFVFTNSHIAISTGVFSLIGFLSARFIPSIRRLFVKKESMRRRVEQRAAEIFLENEIFNTRDRTGILLFVSSFERTALVLGDSGINDKVKKEGWENIVSIIINNIKINKPVEGLVLAIEKCGALLEESGVRLRADDKNELDNKLMTDKE